MSDPTIRPPPITVMAGADDQDILKVIVRLLPTAPALRSAVDHVVVECPISQNAVDSFQHALEILLFGCPHLLSAELSGIDDDTLERLVGHARQASIRLLTLRYLTIQVVDEAVDKIMIDPDVPLMRLLAYMPSVSRVSISPSRITWYADADDLPIGHLPTLTHLRDGANSPMFPLLLKAGAADSLESVAIDTWSLRASDVPRYWTNALHNVTNSGTKHIYLYNLVTLDLRANPGAAFTAELAAFVRVCPRLRRLCIGARPLQHDATSDPHIEAGLYAVLTATPPCLQALLVNCYGFGHGETMEGLAPLLKRAMDTGSLCRLRELTLEAGESLWFYGPLKRMDVPAWLVARRIVVESRRPLETPLSAN